MLFLLILSWTTATYASTPDPIIYGNDIIDDYDIEQFKPTSDAPDDPSKVYSEEWTIYEGHKAITLNKENITLSPDGKWVAFWEHTAGTWIVRADGGIPRRLYYHLEEYEGYLIHRLATITGFTPDNREVLLNVGTIDIERGTEVTLNFNGTQLTSARVLHPVPVILAVDIDTGAVRTVLEVATGGSYSPDGKYFIYVNSENETIILDTFLMKKSFSRTA